MSHRASQPGDRRERAVTDKQIAVYSVHYVAERCQISVGRVRSLERSGLLTPRSQRGQPPGYGPADIERILMIERLSRDLGVNLAGVEVILNMRERMLQLLQELEALRDTR